MALNFRILNISSGISILISFFTLTWQANLLFSASSLAVKYGFSVGKTGPPPSTTTHLQAPQEPLPPQAEGTKIFSSAKEVSSEDPPLTVTFLLPLISISQSP